MIAEWARTKTAAEIEKLGLKHGFAAQRLHNSKDMNEDRHRRERESVKMIDDPLYGVYPDHEFPVMMSKSPPKHKWTVRPVGFDNDYVLKKVLGKSVEQLNALYEKGIVGKWKDMPGRRPPPDWDKTSGAILRR